MAHTILHFQAPACPTDAERDLLSLTIDDLQLLTQFDLDAFRQHAIAIHASAQPIRVALVAERRHRVHTATDTIGRVPLRAHQPTPQMRRRLPTGLEVALACLPLVQGLL